MPEENLNDDLVKAVATGTLKSIAEQPAMLSNLAFSAVVTNTNLAMQNAVANQQAMNELGVAVVGKAVNLVTNLSPLESKSASELLTGNSVAEEIADLKAAEAAFPQQTATDGSTSKENDTPAPSLGDS